MTNMNLRISDYSELTDGSHTHTEAGANGSSYVPVYNWNTTTPEYNWSTPVLSAGVMNIEPITTWSTSYLISAELIKIFNYLFTLAPEEFLKKMEQIEEALSNNTTDFELYNLIMPKEEKEEKEEVFKELLEWE